MTRLFPALRKMFSVERKTSRNALTFFFEVLETILDCSNTVLSTLNHNGLIRLDKSRKRHFSLPCSVCILSTSNQTGESCYKLPDCNVG